MEFDLNTVTGRTQYFNHHAKKEIEDIKEYLENNTFVGFLLAKKSAGKGTYSKMFQEIVGQDRIETVSVGDLVRDTHEKINTDEAFKEDLINDLKTRYRGYISLDDALDAFLGRSQSTLIPTEFILALIEKKIDSIPNKAVFLDGFPRGLDQISYALYFRQIMSLRADPDFFVIINVPETIIEARIKSRVVCPICNTSRNVTLLPTEFVEYDASKNDYVLLCDNNECEGYGKQVMKRKDGDEAGIDPIRARLKTDGELIEKALSLHGIDKIVLDNAVPVSRRSEYQDYEITPEFVYSLADDGKTVNIEKKDWEIKDDNGNEVISLVAAPVVLSMVKQLHKILFK